MRFIVFTGILLLFANLIMASSDTMTWQGQYYTGTTFNEGTYVFNFSVYDALAGGNMCFTNTTSLTTGHWGQWKSEQNSVSASCNDSTKDYYLNINIAGADQPPRRRLTIFSYLRENVNVTTTANITANYFLGNGSLLNGITAYNASYMTTTFNASYVPYSGATTDVNIGNHDFTTTGNGFFDSVGVTNNLTVLDNSWFGDDVDVLGYLNATIALYTPMVNISNWIMDNGGTGFRFYPGGGTAKLNINSTRIQIGQAGTREDLYVYGDIVTFNPAGGGGNLYVNGSANLSGNLNITGNITASSLLRLTLNTTPITCDATADGAIAYLNITGMNKFYGCNTTDWQAFH